MRSDFSLNNNNQIPQLRKLFFCGVGNENHDAPPLFLQQSKIIIHGTAISSNFLVPSPSETWFWGMSVGGTFRRV